MARPNDTTPSPSGQPYKGKDPERTEKVERIELNQQSSILIDGDEDNGHDQHKVAYEDLLRYIHKKPEWLHGKLWLIHVQFDDVIEDCKAQLAEAELSGQAKDGEIVLMKNWLDKTTEWLTQMTLDQDAYINKIAYLTLCIMWIASLQVDSHLLANQLRFLTLCCSLMEKNPDLKIGCYTADIGWLYILRQIVQ